VPENKLIWAGVSETFDPGKVDKVTKEIMNKATKGDEEGRPHRTLVGRSDDRFQHQPARGRDV
jgi:hypothetical protein